LKNSNDMLSEEEEQTILFQWAKMYKGTYPELDLLFHVPNGGKRDKLTAIKLKAQGVKSGVPDLCLPVPRGEYHGLFVELKTKNNTATEKQKEWLCALQKQGYAVAVCYGWENASEKIKKYLSL